MLDGAVHSTSHHNGGKTSDEHNPRNASAAILEMDERHENILEEEVIEFWQARWTTMAERLEVGRMGSKKLVLGISRNG